VTPHGAHAIDEARSREERSTTAVPDDAERTELPIPDRPDTGFVAYDAKDPNSTFPPIEPLRPPAGAPNVLVVLLDDVGFGASSAFGGPSPCRWRNGSRRTA
jgi:arylsulfatase